MKLLLAFLVACSPPQAGSPRPAAQEPAAQGTSTADARRQDPAPETAPPKVALLPDPGARLALKDGQWCAVPRSGRVWCGQVKLGEPGQEAAPGTDTELTDVAALAFYDDSLITLHSDGTMRATRKYGSAPPPHLPAGTFGALARSSTTAARCALSQAGEVVCWNPRDTDAGKIPAGPFQALASSGGAFCGLRPTGTIACWSLYSDEARLHTAPAVAGHGAVALSNANLCVTTNETQCLGLLPSPPSGLALNHLSLNPGDPDATAAMESGCGLTPTGEVRCWGNGGDPPAGRMVDVAVDNGVSCALRDDDQVLCWRHPVAYDVGGPGDGD